MLLEKIVSGNRELYVLNLHGREAMTKYKINLRRN